METDTLPPLVELGRKLLNKAQEGDVEAVQDLMQQGAPFTTDWLGTSPLHWACQLNHIDVAELLLKAGISRDSRNKVDRTPLHCTAQEGFVPVLKLLLSYGVDVDATDMLRMTPLHWAAEYGHLDCVRLLLEHGADPCAVNKFDKTADQIAYDNSRLDITQIVQEYAESPLRQVRRKDAKERQKQYAASHKAALEVERINKQQASRMAANPKEVREVRIVKLPQMRVVSPMQTTPSKVGYESNFGFSTNKTTLSNKIINSHQLTMDTNTEKTLEMLKAHGITMLPNDEGTIVASAVQSGQKVVLTEAGKMALTLTEQSSPLSGKVIKVPPDLFRGKKVIKISPQDLVKMKNEKRVIITTEKTLKPSIFMNKPVPVNQADKSRVDVMVKKTVVNNRPQLTSSVTVEKAAEMTALREESELEKVKRELEESRRQVRELQEQFRRKEKEVEEYKGILNLLKN